MDTTKTCRKCGQVKPLDQFRISNKSSDGHHSYCRPCHNQNTYNRRARLRAARADGAPVQDRTSAPVQECTSAPVQECSVAPLPQPSAVPDQAPDPVSAPVAVAGRRRSKYAGWLKRGVLMRPAHAETLRAWSFHRRQDVAEIVDLALTEYFNRHQ